MATEPLIFPSPRPADPLFDLARRLLVETSLEGVLTAALDGMIESVGAERGMVLLFAADGALRFEAARNLDRSDVERPEFEVSRGVVERVRDGGRPFFSHNLLDDPTLGQRSSVRRLRLLSVICQPIQCDDREVGVVYLDQRHAEHLFDDEAADLAGRFAKLISAAAHRALERRRLEERVAELGEAVRDRFAFDGIVGDSPEMTAALEVAARVADSDATVLVRGESGSGKELVARALHHNSRRRRRPFVAVNCGALPETLLESELFGHVRGAFTGAVSEKEGWFERARGGTLLLDEVAELPPALQVKLLRVLERGEYSPLGSTRVERADVRLVAATHRDLEADVAAGRLRQDFFYRLNVVEVRVPPLRRRRGDVPLLARHLLAELAERHGRPLPRLSPAAERCIAGHDFPGNVRELRNALERALLLAEGETIEPQHLPEAVRARPAPAPADGAPELPFRDAKRRAVEEFERRYVTRALAAAEGNIAAAARAADVDYKNFYTKVKRYPVDPAGFKGAT